MIRMRKTSSFFCGMALMALLVSITGTALAASNAISFNTANLSINGKRIVDKGDVLESSAGAELPSIIRYTDSNGSATHYVSVRFLAEALGMDVSWRGSNSTIDVEAEGDAALYTMAPDNAGVIFDNGELEEITPLTSDSGKVILKETNQSDEPFESTLNPKEGDGDYIVSLLQTVENTPWNLIWAGNCLQQMSQIPLQSRQARVLPEPLK